ncbi:helix-turn-helix transcriptional regulator [Streptomyces sp. MBT27]|uniref:helix-turn-helix domain-containing protein n=1 Tax=Streptomyces sp. MBT27 TaxID=1488356 RepID=UPI001421FF75|nr:helix-turn-helix transcriptional regulator [Streptomyces sp. MBT27]
MNAMPEIRERLRNRRLTAGLTCGDIAERIGVSTATVYRWENGERTPEGIYLVRWAHAVRAGFYGLLDIAKKHDDIPLYASLIAQEYRRKELDGSGTIRNRKHSAAVLLSDYCRKVNGHH